MRNIISSKQLCKLKTTMMKWKVVRIVLIRNKNWNIIPMEMLRRSVSWSEHSRAHPSIIFHSAFSRNPHEYWRLLFNPLNLLHLLDFRKRIKCKLSPDVFSLFLIIRCVFIPHEKPNSLRIGRTNNGFMNSFPIFLSLFGFYLRNKNLFCLKWILISHFIPDYLPLEDANNSNYLALLSSGS